MKKGVHTKGVGGKRIVRKSVSLSNEYDVKSKKLSVSCDISQATLLNLIIEISLDSPLFVRELQDRYTKNEKYRVYPARLNGKVIYPD